MPQVRGSLTAEALRDRTAALASAFVVPLLRHAARPSCGVLWDAALEETRRRLQLLQGCEPAGSDPMSELTVWDVHMVLKGCISCTRGPAGSLRHAVNAVVADGQQRRSDGASSAAASL